MKCYLKSALYLLVTTLVSTAGAGAYDDFFKAVEFDDARTVKALLERGFDPNSRSEGGQVALFLAMRGDSPKVIDVLLASPRIDLDATNTVGETPLMMAALKGNYDGSRKLIERGAKVNKTGWTPLHYAATGPEPRLVELLLDRGADIDAKSPNRSTPLMMAARYGAEDSVLLLVRRGADKKATNDKNLSATDYARIAKREFLLPLLQ